MDAYLYHWWGTNIYHVGIYSVQINLVYTWKHSWESQLEITELYSKERCFSNSSQAYPRRFELNTASEECCCLNIRYFSSKWYCLTIPIVIPSVFSCVISFSTVYHIKTVWIEKIGMTFLSSQNLVFFHLFVASNHGTINASIWEKAFPFSLCNFIRDCVIWISMYE